MGTDMNAEFFADLGENVDLDAGDGAVVVEIFKRREVRAGADHKFALVKDGLERIVFGGFAAAGRKERNDQQHGEYECKNLFHKK